MDLNLKLDVKIASITQPTDWATATFVSVVYVVANDKGEELRENAMVFVRSNDDVLAGVKPTETTLKFIQDLIEARDKGTKVTVELERLQKLDPAETTTPPMALRPVREQLTTETLSSIKW